MIDLAPNESLIIPCYNGNQSAIDFLMNIIDWVPKKNVLIVNDGSNDEFTEFLKSLPFEQLHLKQNQGKGEALKQGLEFLKANGFEFALSLDCDGQHLIEEASLFFERHDRKDYGMIIGKRPFKLGQMPFARILSNRITTAMVGLKAGCAVFDSQCGYRLYNLNVLQKEIWPKSSSYQWESEFLIRLAKAKHKIGFVPISAIYGDEVSHINPFRDTIAFLKMWLKN